MSFIQDISQAAIQVGKKYNILPSLLIAQAILESADGTSGLAVNGKNLFGVKGSFEGRSINLPTTEYENGKPVRVNAAFKKYPSWNDSLEDLCLLYCNGVSWDRTKYHNIIGEKDINKACGYVQTDGYCTDPNYAVKLMVKVKMYNLTQYDPKPNMTIAAVSKPGAKSANTYRLVLNGKYVDTAAGTTLFALIGQGYRVLALPSDQGLTKGKHRYVNEVGNVIDTVDTRVLNEGYELVI